MEDALCNQIGNSKLEFPRFNGYRSQEWLHSCEQFFFLNNIPTEYKVKLVALRLEGLALQWHLNYIRLRYEIYPDWCEYIFAAVIRFGVAKEDTLNFSAQENLLRNLQGYSTQTRAEIFSEGRDLIVDLHNELRKNERPLSSNSEFVLQKQNRALEEDPLEEATDVEDDELFGEIDRHQTLKGDPVELVTHVAPCFANLRESFGEIKGSLNIKHSIFVPQALVKHGFSDHHQTLNDDSVPNPLPVRSTISLLCFNFIFFAPDMACPLHYEFMPPLYSPPLNRRLRRPASSTIERPPPPPKPPNRSFQKAAVEIQVNWNPPMFPPPPEPPNRVAVPTPSLNQSTRKLLTTPQVLDQMWKCHKHVWKATISGCTGNRHGNNVCELFKDLQQPEVKLSNCIFSCMLSLCSLELLNYRSLLVASHSLQIMARQLELFKGRKELGPNADALAVTLALDQHHDAVSGTGKKHVAVERPFLCSIKMYKVCMGQFHHVSTFFMELGKNYQEAIEDTTKKKGVGTVKFICKEVETVGAYNAFCHIMESSGSVLIIAISCANLALIDAGLMVEMLSQGPSPFNHNLLAFSARLERKNVGYWRAWTDYRRLVLASLVLAGSLIVVGQYDPKLNEFISTEGHKFITSYVEVSDIFIAKELQEIFLSRIITLNLGGNRTLLAIHQQSSIQQQSYSTHVEMPFIDYKLLAYFIVKSGGVWVGLCTTSYFLFLYEVQAATFRKRETFLAAILALWCGEMGLATTKWLVHQIEKAGKCMVVITFVVAAHQIVAYIMLLHRKMINRGSVNVPNVLVKWKDLPHKHGTWKSYYDPFKKFLKFILEDKDALKGRVLL